MNGGILLIVALRMDSTGSTLRTVKSRRNDILFAGRNVALGSDGGRTEKYGRGRVCRTDSATVFLSIGISTANLHEGVILKMAISQGPTGPGANKAF